MRMPACYWITPGTDKVVEVYIKVTRTRDFRVGYCREVLMICNRLVFLGAFTEAGSIDGSRKWAEPRDFGLCRIDEYYFDFVLAARWMRRSAPEGRKK